MQNIYICRILTESSFSPAIPNYSSFTEYIYLGKSHYEDEEMLDQAALFKQLSDLIQMSYENADGQIVTIQAKKLVRVEFLPQNFSLTFEEEFLELDQTPYFFNRSMSFESFCDLYFFGNEVD